MTQKFAHENSGKELDKGRQQIKGGGEEQSSFFVLYILYLNKKKQILLD